MSETGIVTASRLNVRRGPSTGEPIQGQLARGAAVSILEAASGWYRIRAEGGVEGYVHGKFLAIPDEEPASSFLFEDETLAQAALEPAQDDQIVTRGLVGRQRDVARTWNSYGGLLTSLSDIVAIHPGCAVAVLLVESGGRGFKDERMIIRFENHTFWRFWGKQNPATYNSYFRFSDKKQWQGHEFRTSATGRWQTFHGKQDQEWAVFELARDLDPDAAMSSISMGAPQIMGFNHAKIGYDSVGEMFDNFTSGDVRFHILGLFDFIRGTGTTSPMLQALQRHDFDQFASSYNGQGQAAKYGGWIEERFETFVGLTA